MIDRSTSLQYGELLKYLEGDWDEEEDFNILDWWKLNLFRFPILLAQLAHDVLIIPVSTIFSEATFSIGGQIITDRRTSLTPEMMKLFSCLWDWEYALKRDQHRMKSEDLFGSFDSLYHEYINYSSS